MGLFSNDHQPGPPGLQLLICGIVVWLASIAVAYRYGLPGHGLAVAGLLALTPILGGAFLWSSWWYCNNNLFNRFRNDVFGRFFDRFDFDTYWLGWFGAAFLIGAALGLMVVFNVSLPEFGSK